MKESLPVDTVIAHYRVISRLGAGGMGEVYLAEDTKLGRKIALKLLPSEFTKDEDRVRRFEQEARAASALNHPNIITIYDIGQADGVHFIATEFIEGQTLRQRLASGRMMVGEALTAALQVAEALQAAHAAGIIHRDIKPENLMLRPDGYVKVLDFGLAKLTERQEATDLEAPTLLRAETDPGTVMGTALYMSPEQARGLKVDARTDLFSLGIVLYEMLAGRVPFAGVTASDIIAAILRAEPEPLARYAPGLPAELQQSVATALRKDCAARYQTAADLLRDLKRLKQRLEFEAELARVSGSQTAEIASRRSEGGSGAEDYPNTATFPLTDPFATNRTRAISGTRRARSRKAIDSLAVLPLINASDDPNAEYLSDGITESIINSLSQLPKLRVVPRSTVFRYKGREVDPQEVGRELGVRAVLSGRLQQLGELLVIKTELVDVAQEAQLWGEQYRRKLTDIFTLQEEISQEISDKLRLHLTREEKKRLVKRYTENTAAYHLYLKGCYFTNKRTREWIQKGIEHFQQAIEVDPNYALAYAGLADSYGFLASSTGGLPPREAYPKAKAAALKALELDDDLAEAHSSLGFFRLMYDWDLAEAEREFKRAVELNPSYAKAHDGYGFYLKAAGRHAEAVQECRQAQQLDPLSPFMHVSLGWAYYFARQYEPAIEQGRKALEMDPRFAFAYWNIGLAYLQQGKMEDAIAALSRGFTFSEGSLAFEAHLGHAYAVAGKRAEAREVIAELAEQARHGYVSAYYFAIVHLGLGELEQAFTWLDRAYEERAGFMIFLKVEPMFDGLRAEARFGGLLRRVGLAG